MPIWRALLHLSSELHDFGDVLPSTARQGSSDVHRESDGADRHAASKHYANRTNYTFKTTAIVDCETNSILDIHCLTKQSNDTQVGWQGLTRNIERLSTAVADKGYDWDNLRRELRENDVRPVIEHREFTPLYAAHDIRIDDTTYHVRSNAESTFFTLRRRLGRTLRARTWYGQFRELVLKAAVRNVEQSL